MNEMRVSDQCKNVLDDQDNAPNSESGHASENDVMSMWKVPAIAQFVSLFKDSLKLPEIEIEELEEGLLGMTETGSFILQNLIIVLLTGIYPKCSVKFPKRRKIMRVVLGILKGT
ncbi:hypothetical protein NPIL_606801 [Nephila pilipes]|uniref:Uncharacterized protein n=1 Tax=Nephila pilipes TaxID=299642 RepID=A0A8X6UFR4_NEPPI|nr:hypothetical protein NPIL_606801 [Nephila pilipes]